MPGPGSPSGLRRPAPQAVLGVAFSLGFTLGPMLGASLPVRTAPWLALLFAVSDLLFLFCFLPETLPPEKRVQWGPETANGSRGWGLGSGGLQGTPRGRRAVRSWNPEAPGDGRASRGPCAPQAPSQAWQVTGGQAAGLSRALLGCWTQGRPQATSRPLQFCPLPGALHHPGAPGCRRPAQPPGAAPLRRRGPWPGPAHRRQ